MEVSVGDAGGRNKISQEKSGVTAQRSRSTLTVYAKYSAKSLSIILILIDF